MSATKGVMRNSELDFIRAIAIIAVVSIHVTAYLPSDVPRTSLILGLVLNQLSRFCVPTFLVVSGILAYKSYTRQGILKIWKKRLVDLVLPYVTWTVISLGFGHHFSPKHIFSTVFTGQGTFYQLYYIVVLVQFYIFLPLIVRTVKSMGATLAIAILSVVILVVYELWFMTSHSVVLTNIMQSSFIAWMVYFVLGCFIGRNYDRVSGMIRNMNMASLATATVICGMLLIAEAFWYVHQSGNSLNGPQYNFQRFLVVLYALCMFSWLLRIGFSVRSRFVQQLYDNSFGIYLSHLLFLLALRRVAGHYLFSNFPESILAIALILFLAFIFTGVTKRISGINTVLFGGYRTSGAVASAGQPHSATT